MDYKSAERTFEEVRRLDKHMIDGMYQYAFVIFQRGERSKLNKLANDLLNLMVDQKLGQALPCCQNYMVTKKSASCIIVKLLVLIKTMDLFVSFKGSYILKLENINMQQYLIT